MVDSLVSSYNQHQKDEAYRAYVTDGFFALVNRTLTYTDRFINLVDPNRNKKEVTASDAKRKIREKLRRK